MREYRIAAIPADGIGKEVIAAGLEVMQAVEARDGGFRLAVETFPWGSDYYRQHGRMMAEDGLAALRKFDAIYFGAVGDKEIPDHITLWGLRLPICQAFDQYANLRPTRILPGIKSPLEGRGPADLDWVIIRENSEGEYAGNGGRVHPCLPLGVPPPPVGFTQGACARQIPITASTTSARRTPLTDRSAHSCAATRAATRRANAAGARRHAR